MVTVVTESIGTASRDRSTPALWEAAQPANLVSSDQQSVGECYNDSKFTSSGNNIDFNGHTSDATRNMILKCATGESFGEDADAATNVLAPDQANGVLFENTSYYNDVIRVNSNTDFAEIIDIQTDGTNDHQAVGAVNGEQTKFKNCLFRSFNTTCAALNNNSEMINCAGIVTGNKIAVVLGYAGSTTPKLVGCTFVCPSDVTNTSKGIDELYGSTNTSNGCLVLGFGTAFDAGVAGDWNGSDDTTSPGANSTDSLTFADTIEATTEASIDLRLKSGSGAIAQSAQFTETADLDIIGQDRDTSTPDIGCWEFQSAAPAAIAPLLALLGVGE